jgi:hypothetical protein
VQISPDEISWKSITTGGLAGIIIELDQLTGSLHVKTRQVDCELEVASIGMEPLIFNAGGVMKRLEIYRLPKKNDYEFDFSFAVEKLNAGSNPIYIKVVQRDGHIAWSSPFYIQKDKTVGDCQ